MGRWGTPPTFMGGVPGKEEKLFSAEEMGESAEREGDWVPGFRAGEERLL